MISNTSGMAGPKTPPSPAFKWAIIASVKSSANPRYANVLIVRLLISQIANMPSIFVMASG